MSAKCEVNFFVSEVLHDVKYPASKFLRLGGKGKDSGLG